MNLDRELVSTFVGKRLLIGITSLDHEERTIEKKQLHGIIARINESEGIVLQLDNSKEEYKLPPDLNSLQVAPKGEYRLHASGEIVVNPDFLTTWTITTPKPEDDVDI